MQKIANKVEEFKMAELNIAKLIGQPINVQLPVAVELGKIADVFTAEPGEHVYKMATLDETADVILTINTSTGALTPVKRSAMSDTELTFTGLVSKQEYVLIDDVLGKVDTNALARRKSSITRGMDKIEVKYITDAIINATSSYFPSNETSVYTVTPESTDDIYDVILKMKHGIEDYGDKYVLLCGKTVKEKIDTFDKDNVTSFNYNVTLAEKIAKLDIEVVKMFGKMSTAANESEADVFDQYTMILVAQNSRIAEGKPIKFVRRKISPAMAEEMGLKVDEAQRAIVADKTPVNISGTDTFGYGVFGYESVILAITNPKAIALADCESILV